MKNLLILILVINTTILSAQTITFNIYSESKLVNLVESEYSEIQGKILVDLDKKYIQIEDNYFHIENIESSKDKKGSYYNFTYTEVEIEKFVTVLFPKRKDHHIIMIIANSKGDGWLYYCEIL